MKKALLSLLTAVISVSTINAQNYCDVNGNLMIFTNYDGGTLDINVDANIPNLKIGVVSYESVVINLSGTYVGNVTGVTYAGYNGTNNHCGSGTVTSISGAPATASTNIILRPTTTLPNPNGYGFIICGYSCTTTSSQGGCNTVDQIEDYFLNHFANSSVYAHKAQYGCWSGPQSISLGGSCCASLSTLQVSARAVNETCSGACDGSIIAGAAGGTPPYNFTVTGSPSLTNLCAGTYTVQVTDGASSTSSTMVTVMSDNPPAPTGDSVQEFCSNAMIANLVATGGTIAWYDSASGGNQLNNSQVLNDGYYYASDISGSCESDRLKVRVVIYAGDVSTLVNERTIIAGAMGVSYQWVDCNNDFSIIPGATNRSYTAVTDGDYAVIITENSCTDTSACVEIKSTGIGSMDEEKIFSIFPNPTDGQLTVVLNQQLNQVAVRVLDAKGAIVYRSNQTGKRFDIDLSSQKKGIYYLEIHSSEVKLRDKVILK